MINKVSLSDSKRFYELGGLVNNNFVNLFDLSSILSLDADEVYGYYDNDVLIGFIHISKLYENMDIVNVVVDINKRNIGIGSKLLEFVINKYDDIDNIMLEVREDNINAIKLYEKYNFKVINKRKKYYGDCDALIMRKVI